MEQQPAEAGQKQETSRPTPTADPDRRIITNEQGQVRAIQRLNGTFAPGVLQPASRPFKPGEVHNPKGNGAGRITKHLIAALEKDDGKLAEAFANVITRKALQGDHKFATTLYERLEGKVADRIADADGKPLAIAGGQTVEVVFEIGTPGKKPIQMVEAAAPDPDPDADLAEKLARLKAATEPAPEVIGDTDEP